MADNATKRRTRAFQSLTKERDEKAELAAMGVELARQVYKLADTLDHNNACQICGQEEGEGHHDTCLYWPAKALLQRAGEKQ